MNADGSAPAGAGAPLWARVRSEIGRRTDTFATAAARVRTHADDDAIHDLRVGVRRLVAILDLWRDALEAKPRRRARNRLRDLRRAIGPTRELEVCVADLSKRLRDQTLAIRLVGADLLDTWRRNMDHGRRRAARRCREKRIARILRAVWRACEALEPALGSGTEPSALPRPALVGATRVAREALTAALLEPATATLHEARIALKRLRYTFEAAAPNGSPADAPEPGALRALQEALGVIHDRATLATRLAEHTRALQDRGLLVHAEALRPLILEVEAEQRAAAEAFMPMAAAWLEPAAESEGAPEEEAMAPAADEVSRTGDRA